MVPIDFTTEHLSYFKKKEIEAIYLFGSRAQGKESSSSDYDYAILMPQRGHAKGDELYFDLYNIFCQVSPRTLKNDIIDIIFLRDVGLELRFHVIRYGKVLIDRKPMKRLNFESQTQLLYCDFRPILDEFDHAILESI